MSIWDDVAVREGPVTLLERDIASGRTAHAYLFAGAAGALPRTTAIAFAAALVCPDAGCGTCDRCHRVRKHAHPDVEIIEPAGTQLLVDQVREVIRSASRKPVAGEHRVIVVDGSDRMNPTSQNAFLKALEEPPPSTTIILLAANPEPLLDTVVSRCRVVNFRSPGHRQVTELLTDAGVDVAQADMVARLGGSLDRARRLADDEELLTLRRELVDRVLAPMPDPGAALEGAEWLATKASEIRDRVATEHAEDDETYKDWYRETKRDATDRLRREQRRAEQDALDAAIDDIASVLRDLVVASLDPMAPLINAEAAEAITQRAAELSPEVVPGLIACANEIEKLRRRTRSNANVLLTLEGVFLLLFRYLSTGTDRTRLSSPKAGVAQG